MMSHAKRIMLCLTALGLCRSGTMDIMFTTVQDEGNACFDMAAAIPELQSIPGKHPTLVNIYLQSNDSLPVPFVHDFNH